MPRSEFRFAGALRKAVDYLAFHENKKRQLIYDELGYSIGREGGSAVSYWAYRQRIPFHISEVEMLARAITQRGGWEDAADLFEFLDSAGHPEAHTLAILLSGKPSAVANHEDRIDSPFVIGPPILNPRQFFGRERELRRVFLALRGSVLQNVAVVGLQRSGKTSLLHYLRMITTTAPERLRPGQRTDWLPIQAAYRWVFIDFQDPRMLVPDNLFAHILSALDLPVNRPLDLNTFIDTACTNIDFPVVLLMDEVQAALNAEGLDERFWWGLRSLGTNLSGGRLGFVIASQVAPERLLQRSGQPSPFFNIFGHIVQLGPLTGDEARGLIEASPLQFSEEEIDWILAESRCWPALVQTLCQSRLSALLEAQNGDSWKEEARMAMAPYVHLLETTG